MGFSRSAFDLWRREGEAVEGGVDGRLGEGGKGDWCRLSLETKRMEWDHGAVVEVLGDVVSR